MDGKRDDRGSPGLAIIAGISQSFEVGCEIFKNTLIPLEYNSLSDTIKIRAGDNGFRANHKDTSRVFTQN